MSAALAEIPELETTSAVPAAPRGPILASIAGSASDRATIEAAVRHGRERGAPIVFVYVRRGPSALFGEPVYQRRLSAELRRARHALDRALAAAEAAGVAAEGEILEGKPRRRLRELAEARRAPLVVAT